MAKPRKSFPPIGTWVRISWIDAPSRIGLYLGDEQVLVLERSRMTIRTVDSPSQVIKTSKRLSVPFEALRQLQLSISQENEERARLAKYEAGRAA